MGPSELISRITNRSPCNLGNDGAAERRGRETRPLPQLHRYSFFVSPPGGMLSSSRAQFSICNKDVELLYCIPLGTREKTIIFTMFQFSRVDKTSRGNTGFPDATRERPRKSSFNASWIPIPLPWLESNDVFPLATRMETWLPWRHTRGSLSSPSYLVRNPTLAPQLEKTHETPPSSRDEGLLFLHGLESNLEASLQTPQEAWLPLGHSVGSKRYPLGLERRAEFFASPIYQDTLNLGCLYLLIVSYDSSSYPISSYKQKSDLFFYEFCVCLF